MLWVSRSSFLLKMAPTEPCRHRAALRTRTRTRPTRTPPGPAQDTHLHGLGDLVHVLGLDDGPQVVLQDFGEVVLQLRTSEVGQDLLPVRRVLGQNNNKQTNVYNTKQINTNNVQLKRRRSKRVLMTDRNQKQNQNQNQNQIRTRTRSEPATSRFLFY